MSTRHQRFDLRLHPFVVVVVPPFLCLFSYASLEAESGITFHSPCGFVACAANPTGPYATRMQESAETASASAAAATAAAAASPTAAVAAAGTGAPSPPFIEELEIASVAERFPFLNLCSTTSSTTAGTSQTQAGGGNSGIRTEGDSSSSSSSCAHRQVGGGSLEAAKARAWVEPSALSGGRTGGGWVSARKLLEAQQTVFLQRGGTWLREAVDKVEPLLLKKQDGARDDESSSSSGGGNISVSGSGGGNCDENAKSSQEKVFKVYTASGKELLAPRVLIATNTATNFRQLLPSPLALTLHTQVNERDCRAQSFLDLSCPIPISFLNLCLPNTPHFLVSFPINPSYFVSQTLFACVCSRPPAASCSHLKKPQVYAACLPWCSNGMPWTRHLLAPQLPRALWCELIIIIILGVIELMLSTSPSIFSILGGRGGKGGRRKLLFLLFKDGKLFRAVNFHFVLSC